MKFSNFLPAILLTFVGLAGAGATAHASTLEDITKRGELRVAVQTQGPPFSMIDKNGERTGSSVELAKLMAKEMGVKVVFLDLDWDGLLPALLSGKADLLAADMTPTLARGMKAHLPSLGSMLAPWLPPRKVASSTPSPHAKRVKQRSPFCLAALAKSWQKQFSPMVSSKATKAAEHCSWMP